MTQTSDSVSEAVKLLRQAADLLDSRESGTLPQLTHQHRNRQSTTPTSSTVLQEQRQLFGRLNRPSATTTRLTNVISSTLRGNGNKEASQKRKKVKKILCMLASRSASKVPSLQDRAILQANGLGDKTVYFPVHGTASDVKSSLMREFPALEDGGGFELLRTAERSRTDLIVSCVGACSVDHLCSISTGRVYIRPIQANLLIDNSRTVISSDELEECLSCGSLIPLEEIRKHLKDCKRTTNSETADQEEDVLSLENAPNNINSESGNQLHLQQVEDLPDPVEDVPIFERIPDNSESANLLDLQQTSSEPVGTDTFLNDIFKDLRDMHDPVAILKCYQKHFMTGRLLELDSESATIEGETLPIYVSRERLLETGFRELLEADLNFRLPLEVTFYGEEAEDLGGPRKEFLGSILKEMTAEHHRLFTEENGLFKTTDDQYRKDQRCFFAAGLVCGLSVLQNGPLPTFLKDFDSMLESPTESQNQFLEGLNIVGLTDLIRVKPCMKFLFHPGASADVTVRKLRHLLHPKFDEIGSNRRTRQEKVYEIFFKYIKEVAAGRREVPKGKIFFGDILTFVTSSAREPVLGYTLSPKITFVEDNFGSLIPTSSTCTNTLFLPIPGALETFPEATKLFTI